MAPRFQLKNALNQLRNIIIVTSTHPARTLVQVIKNILFQVWQPVALKKIQFSNSILRNFYLFVSCHGMYIYIKKIKQGYPI